jgi:hypothetical protein
MPTRTCPRTGATGGLLAALLLFSAGLRAEDRRTSSVGMPARVGQVVLPGPELEARPVDPKAPVVVRVVNTYPHGTAFRYDLVYYGLEPGTFDLKDYLRRKDGSSTADLPALPVKIEPLLPPGQVLPNPLESRSSPWLGGYRLALTVGAVLWGLGLLALVFVGRRKKRDPHGAGAAAVTLGDRLRPLVERARAGSLARGERADLERILLAYWRRRLGLGDEKPAVAFARLRQHPEAGPLLEQLEEWLHRPGENRRVDVAALLQPYQDLPAEAVEEFAGAERGA